MTACTKKAEYWIKNGQFCHEHASLYVTGVYIDNGAVFSAQCDKICDYKGPTNSRTDLIPSQTEQLITVNTRFPAIGQAVPVIWCHKDGMFMILYDNTNMDKPLGYIKSLTGTWLSEMKMSAVFQFDSIEKIDHVLVLEDRKFTSPVSLPPAEMLDKLRERYIVKLKRV